MSEPSPSNRRLASESRRVPQVLHRKQSMCHLFPAVRRLVGSDKNNLAFVRTRNGKSLPSSNALPSSRICTVVSSAIARVVAEDSPRRSLCTGRRRRLGPWATRGKCPETPLPEPSHNNSVDARRNCEAVKTAGFCDGEMEVKSRCETVARSGPNQARNERKAQ